MKGKIKRGKNWCYKCDAEIVEFGKKCTNCGHRDIEPKIKKPNMKKLMEE